MAIINTSVCNYPPRLFGNGKDGKAECLLKSSACLSGVSAQISESKRRFAPAGRARLSFCPIEETCVLLCLCVQIREELRANGIDVYPQKEFDEDAEDRLINDKIRVSQQPPAVCHHGPTRRYTQTHLSSIPDAVLRAPNRK